MRAAVDAEVVRLLGAAGDEVEELHPGTALLVGELDRVHRAGGGRVRGVLTWWGHRAGGAEDGPPIVTAAAGIELLHLMALIHDDLMDETATRRGVPTVHVALADEVGSAERGRSLAILTGDLAAVLADRAIDGAGFPAERVLAARARYDAMRVRMATGQFLDVSGAPAPAEQVASLKGGSYSVEGPLLVGAELAGASAEVLSALAAYGRPAGIAFQFRDDVRDGEADAGVAERAVALRAEALAALGSDVLPAQVRAALTALLQEVTV